MKLPIPIPAHSHPGRGCARSTISVSIAETDPHSFWVVRGRHPHGSKVTAEPFDTHDAARAALQDSPGLIIDVGCVFDSKRSNYDRLFSVGVEHFNGLGA